MHFPALLRLENDILFFIRARPCSITPSREPSYNYTHTTYILLSWTCIFRERGRVLIDFRKMNAIFRHAVKRTANNLHRIPTLLRDRTNKTMWTIKIV